jgi:signal transduction histidine kinase
VTRVESSGLERVAEEQAALRRVATLVAEGATEAELAAAVTAEVGRLFEADRATTMRCETETFRAIGVWGADGRSEVHVDQVFPLGGDTLVARVIEAGVPGRLDSAAELVTDFGRARWEEFGLQAAIGAPIVVDGSVWGVVICFRTRPDHPFPRGMEHHLGDFAALVAQAIVNAEARRETAELVAEQSALRRIATFVAGGRPQAEVLDAVLCEVASTFGATAVDFVRWEGVENEVLVVSSWSGDGELALRPGSVCHPTPGCATLGVLESGQASCGQESSPERGERSVIAAPIIVQASLHGALTASRPVHAPFLAGAEIRLRSFADLAAQSIANEHAREELRASRARIVRTADETRRRLERNLHDGAQQRLVSVSLTLRLAMGQLWGASREEVSSLLADAAEELTTALDELRDLARGLHPALLTERGLGPAIAALAERAPQPVTVVNEIAERLPEPAEAALYFVVSESLANVAKHAEASEVAVRVTCGGGVARVEVADDGRGGADLSAGSGLQGLFDRIEALGGTLSIESTPGVGTTVAAEVPVATERDSSS